MIYIIKLVDMNNFEYIVRTKYNREDNSFIMEFTDIKKEKKVGKYKSVFKKIFPCIF